MKRLLIIQIILACNLFSQGTAATVPIADGNTWVYQHHSSWLAFSPTSGPRDGLYIISIDSVSTRGDSVFFRVTTIDSGTGSNVAFGDYAYDTRDTNSYLLTNNMLFVMDTTGAWKTYSASLLSGPLLSYMVQPDTSYRIEDTMPYKDTVNYQRKTDSAAVIINSGDTGTFYSSIKDSSYTGSIPGDTGIPGARGGNFGLYIHDTIQWLENIGPFYQVHTMNYWNSAIYDVGCSTIDRYSLVSFNGTPITITPAGSGVRNTSLATKQNVYRSHGKIVWLGDGPRSIKNAGSNRYYNLTGRRVNPLKGTQLLIYKKQ